MCLCILEFSKIAALGHEYISFSEVNLFSVLSALSLATLIMPTIIFLTSLSFNKLF